MNRRRDRLRPSEAGMRQHVYDIIFEADTPAGRWFDIGLLIAILISIIVVAVETVPSYSDLTWLPKVELVLTLLFAFEYALRLYCVNKPARYIFSFWGIIDLLSFLPSLITGIIGPGRSFAILRSIRLLRTFRVLKLWRMIDESNELGLAVWRARNKIIVFLIVVLVAVTISGALMYQIETVNWDGSLDPDSQFTSIPQSMYWAIVTMTTVGYGDIVPHTTFGKAISAALILLGYSLIIVPSTFVSAEIQIAASDTPGDSDLVCENCDADGHRPDAQFCYRCGESFH
ncbi:MAG: ion transporter [Planctomycetota bacterium]